MTASVGLTAIRGGPAASPERRASEAMMAVQRDEDYEPTVAHLPWELKRAERAAIGSPATVRTYVENAMHKLKADSRTHAVARLKTTMPR